MKKIKFLLSTLLILVLFSMISCSSGSNFSYEETKLNQKLTINFETNGGTSKESKTFESGTKVSEIVTYINNVPTKESAEFYNWFGLEGVFEHSHRVQIDSNSWSYETDDYFYIPNHVCSDCYYKVNPLFCKDTITLVALWKSDSPSIIINNSDLDFSLDNADNVKPYYIFSSDEYSEVDYGKLNFVNSEGEKLSSRIIKDGYFCDFFVRTNYYDDIDFVCTPNFEPSKNITFESNGGTACEKIIFVESFDLNELPIPTKENNCFVGWYEDKELKNLCTGRIRETTTLYAKWISKSYTATPETAISVMENIYSQLQYENSEYVVIDDFVDFKIEGILDKEMLAAFAKTISKIKEESFYDENENEWKNEYRPILKIKLDLAKVEGLTDIKEDSFKDCLNIIEIKLSKGVSSINNNAFSGCKNLSSVEIPASLTHIGDSAFERCVSLCSIVIPDGVKFVGKSAFANCSELTSIKLPDSVLTIGSSAFMECKKLTNVTLPKWIEILPSSIFSNCSVLKSISIPNAVENIGDNAFLGCIALESIVIPENVITLGSSAFSGCEALTTVKLNDKIVSIEDSTFYNAKKLCSITGVSKIRIIKQSAFAGCASLVTIENLQMLESIGQQAFKGCASLVTIENLQMLESIGQQAFKDCIVFEKITLPTCFESIGSEAFFNCKALKQLLLPENVSSIGESAFISCVSLEKINIPSKVKTLSAHVFHQCTSLISITIDEGVETILDRAFFECKKLQSIVLPSSLKVIDTSVFLNCTSLKAITIPEKVYAIGNGIIVGCSSISSVEFKNTTDWYSTENPNYKGGETFDTSNTSKNVSSLKNEKLFLYNSVLKDLEDQTNNDYSL